MHEITTGLLGSWCTSQECKHVKLPPCSLTIACLQVLDARDPLRYRSEDLEGYSIDLHPTKQSVLLLNKADLLPAALRSAWADYFEQQGVQYVFWSAKAGIDSLTAPGELLLSTLLVAVISCWVTDD